MITPMLPCFTTIDWKMTYANDYSYILWEAKLESVNGDKTTFSVKFRDGQAMLFITWYPAYGNMGWTQFDYNNLEDAFGHAATAWNDTVEIYLQAAHEKA